MPECHDSHGKGCDVFESSEFPVQVDLVQKCCGFFSRTPPTPAVLMMGLIKLAL